MRRENFNDNTNEHFASESAHAESPPTHSRPYRKYFTGRMTENRLVMTLHASETARSSKHILRLGLLDQVPKMTPSLKHIAAAYSCSYSKLQEQNIDWIFFIQRIGQGNRCCANSRILEVNLAINKACNNNNSNTSISCFHRALFGQ